MDAALNCHCTILLNAKAGALHTTAGIEQVRELVQEIGLDAAVIETHSRHELRSRVRQLVQAGVQKIGIAGGDGTVSLAVQEMAHSDSALGIIPQGTFNNFATALRLPQDLPSALRALLDGEERGVDLGALREGKRRTRYFTEAAGVGFFADALAMYGKGTNKNLLRGLYAFLRVVASLRAHKLVVQTDRETITERALLCSVSNTYRMAQAVPVAPGAQVTDGLLDVVIIGDLERHELLPYYRAMRAQMHTKLPKVKMLQAKEIRIRSKHRLNVHCDDQVLRLTPVRIKVQPQALKVLVARL